MARRRLLTILAASAVWTTALAGPAVALDLEEPVAEIGAEVESGIEEVVEVVGAAEEVVRTPRDVVEVVAPSPEPEPSPEPSQEPREQAPSQDSGDRLVAAGTIDAAPVLSFLTRLEGSAATPGRTLDAPAAVPAPARAESTESVPAPAVAPAPAQTLAAPAADTVAQPLLPLPDKGAPGLALVALATVLAAGAWTLHEARATATA